MRKQAMAKIVEINKQELSTQKVELGIFNDIEKLKDKVVAAMARADKSVLNVLSDLADATAGLEQAIKITEEGKQKAKELGVDELVKRADKISAEFNRLLKLQQKNISDLRSIRNNIN
tara:strand:+ start:477 stop:830 length:354 start_codon:yes stop_codon:yes gene_type:complete